MADKANVRPLYCSLIDEADRVRGMALLFQFASPNVLLRHVTSKAYCDAHPVVEEGDPALFSGFIRQIEAHASSIGSVDLTIGSFGTPGHRAELEQLGYSLTERFEFVVPLDRTDDQLKSAMEHGRRQRINKAAKAGVTVETLDYKEGIGELRRLLEITGERLNKRGANVDFGPVRPPDKDPVRELAEAGRGELVGARFEGRLVSISLYTRMNGLVYSALADHAPEAYELNAYTLLLWVAMGRYRGEGDRRLNLGGVPAAGADKSSPDHGLYTFKTAMGAVREDCTTGFKILKPIRYRLSKQAKEILSR